MELIINDEKREYTDGLTVAELLVLLNLANKFVAVERNREVVSFRHYQETILHDQDQLEIVTLVGGG